MHWPMIQLESVPLIMKDGTRSMQTIDRACPMSTIERLIIFLLSDHTFCYSGAPLLPILCISLRAFPEMIQDFFLCKAS